MFAGMNAIMPLENDIHHADRRHPVDILEPLSPSETSIQRICEVLSRTFGWVADGGTVEQKGLRASMVLYCVRADLIDPAALEEIAELAGIPQPAVDGLITDFCHTIGWE